MAILSDRHDCLTVMVTFECSTEQQAALADKVRAYIRDFISQQPGLISSHLHLSLCGTRVVNYAQWRSMDDFKAFGERARLRPELPALLAYKPKAVFYRVDFSVEDEGSGL